ncbi:MAG: enoyl-CoA hydratase/isomerase family protein [Vicinamibacterales bacterium]
MITLESRHDGALLALTFAEAKGNLLTEALVRDWRRVLADLREPTRARHVKLLTITGDGADFSFGASIVEHAPDRIAGALPDFNAFILDLLQLPMPTAALVRGRCLGGGLEVALACDFIFAEERASIGLPEVLIGAFAPIASVLLPARIGAARATSALLTGRIRSAQQWHGEGLVEAVWADGTMDAELDQWFRLSLGKLSAEALRHAVIAARRDTLAAATAGLPETGRLYLDSLARTYDAAEGVSAFLNKRAPAWRDE